MERIKLALPPIEEMVPDEEGEPEILIASSMINGYCLCIRCEDNKYVLYVYRQEAEEMLFIHESDRLETFNKHYEAALNVFYLTNPDHLLDCPIDGLAAYIVNVMYKAYKCDEILNRVGWDSLKNKIISMETGVNK